MGNVPDIDMLDPPEDIQPAKVDNKVRFSSIGGLKEHKKCLREMIIFPLMYPELFKKFNSRPAKGVLFHGPPGTGKTLLARALATECSLLGGRKVSFFMRKGADIVDKYYGESEKKLRRLFQTARKMKPSIIFFDEMDALAPARSMSRHHHDDSVVGTLLAEMDGMSDRGDVIVIGATNRPEAIDLAVRRTGRFDKELYFPPPELDARRDILAIYTKDWDPELSDETLDYMAKVTAGYLGSDIKALCSEAVLTAVRRVYPQIYDTDYKLLVNATNVEVTVDDMVAAMAKVFPSSSRSSPPPARPLPAHTAPLLRAQVEAAASLLRRVFCVSDRPPIPGKESTTAPSAFLVSGECAETHLAPALLSQLEHCVVKELSLSTLHSGSRSPEQTVISLFAECRCSGRPCVIFIRDLLAVWATLARRQSAAILMQLWRLRSVGDNTLLLATCLEQYERLPSELQQLFPAYKECIYRVRKPTRGEVQQFLTPVIKELPLVPPIPAVTLPPPPLPRAPLDIGPYENEEDRIRRLFRESENLRLLRRRLKRICRNLESDRRYEKFIMPLDTQILQEHINDIEPMSLSTVNKNIDRKKYFCAKDFINDIDLICTNALQCKIKYKKYHQDALSLYVDAHTMVTEEIDAQLELECQLIAKRRCDGSQAGDDDSIDVPGGIYYSKLSPCDPPTCKLEFRSMEFNGKRQSDTPYEVCAKRPRSIPSKETTRMSLQKNPPSPDIIDGLPVDNLETPELMMLAEPDKNITQPKEVLINPAELDNILKKNINHLCNIGLEKLIDLYAQLSKTVDACAKDLDRTKLPNELQSIVIRYVQTSHIDLPLPLAVDRSFKINH